MVLQSTSPAMYVIMTPIHVHTYMYVHMYSVYMYVCIWDYVALMNVVGEFPDSSDSVLLCGG